jgi:acetyl esterase/lipase
LWENYVGDAAATLAYLQEQVEIDASRTAMIGHSEGGMLILQAAVEGMGFRQPPAALVLASTPGRHVDVVLREQLARDLVARFFLTKNDEILAAIKKTGQVPDDVPSVLAGLYPPEFAKFLQSQLDFDAPSMASRFPGPVLVLSGEKDLQHVVAQETAALSNGLKKREPDDHEVYIAPDASHNLKRVKSNNDHGFGGDLTPEAAAKLRTEIDSMPTELDEISRRVMQLEIEREALKKEKDAASKDRLAKLEDKIQEAADHKAQLDAREQRDVIRVESYLRPMRRSSPRPCCIGATEQLRMLTA